MNFLPRRILPALLVTFSFFTLPVTSDAAQLTPAQVQALNSAYGTAWQFPVGPYRQAPPEYGMGWWFTSPFVGSEPWKNSGTPVPPVSVPAGFEAVFGPHPGIGDRYYGEWTTNLKYFKGIGTPLGFSNAEINSAIALFEDWGLGTPIFYEGRYGWNTRFPNQAELWDFDCSVSDAIKYTHFVIARYQIRLVQETGAIPSKKHPFVPPFVFTLP